MDSWEDNILGAYIDSISDTFQFTEDPVVFLNTSDISDGTFLTTALSEPKTLPGQAKKSIKKGDLLFSEIRPKNRRFARVTFDASDYVVSTKLMVLRSKGKIDPVYLEYFLTTKNMLDYLQMIAEDRSGTFPQITFDIISTLKISLPPLPEQKAIAEVLSSLDDKIDLLHRQNKTLEAMAETLFRQWFEEKDFDSTTADVVHIQTGYAFKSKDFSEAGLNKVIKIKNISGSTVDVSNADRISESVADNVNAKFSIVSGDILFAMTGAEIGKMGIVERNGQNLWLNQRVGLFKEKFKGSKYLAYLCLKSDFGQDYIDNTATGSAQPNISGTGIENCPFPKLTTEQIEHYSQILIPQFDKIVSNLGNIKTLTNLRDTLLPKLMSGDVRVNLKKSMAV